MRFLCLHGYGSTAAIFAAHTANIRYELGKEHIYDFVQVSLLAEMAPGLETLSDSDSTHFAYYELDSPSSFILALDKLRKYIDTEGPFDGTMAFSHGAGLAAMHIVDTQLNGGKPAFKSAVLFASNDVYDPIAWQNSGVVRLLDAQLYGRLISIPTVIVYGAKDLWKDRSERTIGLCTEGNSFVVKHTGGHDVPGLVVKEAVHDVVKMIRRILILAKCDA